MRSQPNENLASVLENIDLGSSIAEHDNLLWQARVETSAFADLARDLVDLVPGTKGSGKSALHRLFVDYLGASLLRDRKVVVAHGVEKAGDSVFGLYGDEFAAMDEDDFVNFWCIYLVSLADEQFVKNPQYSSLLTDAQTEIARFRTVCHSAGVPEFRARKELPEVLSWAISAARHWRPKLRYSPPGNAGTLELDLFGSAKTAAPDEGNRGKRELPRYVAEIRTALEAILAKSDLSLWLMVDRLDELFLRRSEVETCALRGLLRTLRIFDSPRIRVKVFLRDDILEQIVSSGDGFVALSHITDRQTKPLRWTEDEIMAMIVNRLFASDLLCAVAQVARSRLSDPRYRRKAFYEVMPPTVYRGQKQSPTDRWIYHRVEDGKGVVTPRDVIDLLKSARQHQLDLFLNDPHGTSDYILSPAAIQFGYREASKRKTQTYLAAEFPHMWEHINRFRAGKTTYAARALRAMFGGDYQRIADNLVSIGFLTREGSGQTYKIPFVYREGLELTQGTRRT
jgi:hypothetical protein